MPVPAPPDPLRARRRAYKGISGGVTLICIGLVLLLNTLGTVGWGVWIELLKLWPIVLISIGLRWIFVSTPLHPLCLIGPLLIAGATFWVVSNYHEADGFSAAGLRDAATVDLACPPPAQGATARLDLDFAAGELRLLTGPAADPNAAARTGFEGSVRYTGGEPQRACATDGDLRLRSERHEIGIHFVPPFGDWEHRWEARLAAASPVSIDMHLAASTVDLDLGGFDLRRLEANVAASRLVVRLGPPRARVPVTIEGAVDSMRLVMPEGACYTINRERVLSFLDVGEDVRKDDRRRRLSSEACATAAPDAPRYEIRYELPLSSVTIDTREHPV